MTRGSKIIDAIMRAAAALMLSIFAYRIVKAELQTPSLVLTLLLISEALIVGLVIFAKPTATRVFSVSAVISTAGATFFFLFIDLSGGDPLVPDWLAELIMTVGLCLQITAKIYLGRNFGLLPAVRGIVTTGPYGLVRHPIYLGYFVAHMGFLLSFYSPLNVAICIALYGLQFIRIMGEERVLMRSVEYQAYMRRVTKRFIPFLL